MNYPDLIWRLIELVLQKETDNNQKNDKVKNQLDANAHDETL